jgi:hypothetical protein
LYAEKIQISRKSWRTRVRRAGEKKLRIEGGGGNEVLACI